MIYRAKRKPQMVLAGKPPRKRAYSAAKYRRHFYGLVPSYRGFNPRAMAHGEWKFVDTAIAGQAIYTTSQRQLLNGLTQGSAANNRIGQKILVQSIEARLFCLVYGASSVYNVCRFFFVWDKQANGIACSTADILDADSVTGLRNLTNRHRFKIVLDKTFVTSAYNVLGCLRSFHVYVKFKRPVSVDYNNASTGNISDISTNALYLFTYGAATTAATGHTLTGQVRIRYTDV